MKICRLQLKLLSLVFAFSCLGLLLSANTVKAANGESFVNSGTITTGTDQILFCFYVDSNNVNPTLSWNGEAMTQFGNYFDGASWYGRLRLFYLVNPSIGTYSIIRNNNNWNENISCVVYENVNQTTPIINSRAASGNPDSYDLTQTSGNNTVLYWWNASSNFSSSDPAWTNNIYHDSTHMNPRYSGLLSAITSGTQQVVFNSVGWSNSAYFIELNNSYVAPPSDSLVILPMTELQDTYLKFDNVIQSCSASSTCVLKYKYDVNIFDSFSDFIKVYFYPTSTSSPQYLGDQPIATKWELGIIGSGYLATSSAVSTDYFSYYQVVPCQFDGSCFGTSTVAFYFVSQPNPLQAIQTQIQDDLASASTTEDLKDETLISGMFTVGVDFLSGVFKPFLSLFYNIFPFNLPIIFVNAWTASADLALPEDITLFNSLDENGDISLDLPISSSSVVVFGPSLLLSETITSNHYSSVRSFSSYLLWFLFAMAVYAFAKRIISGLDEDRSFNYVPPAFKSSNPFRPITKVYRVSKGKRSKTYSARF